MGNMFTRYFDRLRGSGEAAITLPPMDGALRPNNRIEEADEIAAVDEPDNLVRHNGGLIFSSGSTLHKLEEQGAVAQIATETSAVCCLASHASGALAIGLEEGQIIIRGGAHDGQSFTSLGDTQIVAPSAMVFEDAATLLICLASQVHGMDDWKRDLMTFGASGSVWRLDLITGAARCLARDLAFPSGIVVRDDGAVLVSESWRHRVISIADGGEPGVVLDELPGYPSRLIRGDNNDLWLCIFAPRTQLIEFVLKERAYRERMLAEIDPEYWIAPSLHAPTSYLEPMQGGGLKQLGELKPWAPSRSIGLVVRLDADGRPLESLHSRANGKRHGITSCLPVSGGLLIASKGGDTILKATT